MFDNQLEICHVILILMNLFAILGLYCEEDEDMCATGHPCQQGQKCTDLTPQVII